MEAIQVTAELAKYGAVGVMMALIILCGYFGYLNWRMSSAQIKQSNEIFLKVIETLEKNSSAFDRNTKASEQMTERLNTLIDR